MKKIDFAVSNRLHVQKRWTHLGRLKRAKGTIGPSRQSQYVFEGLNKTLLIFSTTSWLHVKFFGRKVTNFFKMSRLRVKRHKEITKRKKYAPNTWSPGVHERHFQVCPSVDLFRKAVIMAPFYPGYLSRFDRAEAAGGHKTLEFFPCPRCCNRFFVLSPLKCSPD